MKKWDSYLIEDLTDVERKEVLEGKSREELLRWINTLCRMIKATESESRFIDLDDAYDTAEGDGA